ncbi:hypothetical protein [Brevibacillus laterosporus]|uniref:hypothetical protein n=1 Tax=Brevibacillus laterosporus TaxID=1465 RepID=UPI001443B4A3|nr:hypothetical protein [Brevibacillus laterosporus]NKQ20358.1 hypothetical protein [Brevibacillus laterosporus]WNX31010.1 hypothetical protein RWW94_23025 [Brevibacillus laterosporus]
MNEDQKVTVADLEKAGYTVAFQATKAVFANNGTTSATGELKNNLTGADNFKYKVVVSKDNEKFESALVSATVLDAQVVIEPTEVKMMENGAAIDKAYATLGQNLSVAIKNLHTNIQLNRKKEFKLRPCQLFENISNHLTDSKRRR